VRVRYSADDTGTYSSQHLLPNQLWYQRTISSSTPLFQRLTDVIRVTDKLFCRKQLKSLLIFLHLSNGANCSEVSRVFRELNNICAG